MKKIIKKIIICSSITLITIFFASCGDEPDVEYKVRIVSTNADMSGYHFCDSDTTVPFSKTKDANSIATYEEIVCTNPEYYIQIYAITADNAEDLVAYIYRDGQQVAEYNTPTATGDKYYIKQTYTIVSDDNSSSEPTQ